jgi:signal transduction histidine kinase
VELPDDEERTATLIDRNGQHVAALIHDPTLDDEPELLEAVGAAAEISLENARLHAELRARVEELRGSRARVIEAGQKERKRLERNLHDGAQQHLVALLLSLKTLRARSEGRTAETLDRAIDELEQAVDELVELARGIHPASLTRYGLGPATAQLARRAPLEVSLEAPSRRFPENVEAAAYYVVSETLANVVKYAEASSASIAITDADGCLRVVVADDGVGGADPARGSGLRGLVDRLAALDGTLAVDSPAGGGTRVTATIPVE